MQPERDPMVQAWIDDYQRSLGGGPYPVCKRCGYPHSSTSMCVGAIFGRVRLGGEFHYVSSTNVEWMRAFVRSLNSGFHWRDEVFFDVKDGNVVVSRVERSFNGWPCVKRWSIPLREWQSITDFVAASTGVAVAA